MAINIDMTYRINRNLDQDDKMRYLTRELKIFNSYSQILTISTLLGYANDAYVPFEKNAEPVLMTFFSNREYELMNLLAYKKVGNQSILQEKRKDDPNRNEMYHIFEYYANGGFPILCKKLGVDFVDTSKNNRITVLLNYYNMLVSNDIYDE